MVNSKLNFRVEIKKLASERKKRRERNERGLRREYRAADVTECGCPCIGYVDDISRGRPEKAVERLREYAEIRNRIMLMLEDAMVEVREVIRKEVKPKPITVKQLKLIFRKVQIFYVHNPKRSYLLQMYREKVAEPPRPVSEIEVMSAKEMKRELSRLGLNFLTVMSKTVLKKILVDNAIQNKDLKPKPFEWDHRIGRHWFAMSQWYFTRKLTTEPFTIWADVKREDGGISCNEIKKLASERKKRREFNIRNTKRRLAEEVSWEKSIAREETRRKNSIAREETCRKNSIAREEVRRRGVVRREKAAEKRRVLEEKRRVRKEKTDRRDLNETVRQRDQRLRRNELARIRRAKKKELTARLLDLNRFFRKLHCVEWSLVT
ncbi:Hypothetical predicted protein [Paramuricea clavata]|uniref:Uncharacterized protein n=1 Tax=Paramuricea clavata TaxID=317549 RepID=A0A7D9EYN7_PARCT|nr:Hypothetical predicted protein [Paramuricea clavata]